MTDIETNKTGTLYICATPIGNLEDITYRAVRILSEADMIYCEDTRRTLKLLNHLNIKKPLFSYYLHNSAMRDGEIIEKLTRGAKIALVSDAGMPLISDPGESIVKEALDRGIYVTVLPGACAAVSALVLSGFETDRFIFEGFLPKKGPERKRRIDKIAEYDKTVVIYESPHHLKKTLEDLSGKLSARNIALVREMTKIHEEVFRGLLCEAIENAAEPRGEYVIVIEKPQEKRTYTEDDIIQSLRLEISNGASKKEAVKIVAGRLDVKKSNIYMLAERLDCL